LAAPACGNPLPADWQEWLAFCPQSLDPIEETPASKVVYARTLCNRQENLFRRILMNNLDLILKRNKESAAPVPSLPESLQTLKAVIIGCADMRVDPSHVLGIKPGEAVVMRNIGGRVTPGLLEEFGLLGRIGEVAETIPGGGGEFHLIVLHHTDCGSTRLVGDPAMLARYFQIPEKEVESKSVRDPRKSVAVDVAALRAIPALPDEWLISGLVYDVATGLVEVVVPAAPIRAAQERLTAEVA
jgi:carbonic anhydrase